MQGEESGNLSGRIGTTKIVIFILSILFTIDGAATFASLTKVSLIGLLPGEYNLIISLNLAYLVICGIFAVGSAKLARQL